MRILARLQRSSSLRSLCVCTVLLLFAATVGASEAPRFALEVDIDPAAPGATSASGYSCTFVVTDIESNEVFFAPTVRVAQGDTGRLLSENVPVAETFELDFDAHCLVDSEKREASYTVEIRQSAGSGKDEAVLLRVSSRVGL